MNYIRVIRIWANTNAFVHKNESCDCMEIPGGSMKISSDALFCSLRLASSADWLQGLPLSMCCSSNPSGWGNRAARRKDNVSSSISLIKLEVLFNNYWTSIYGLWDKITNDDSRGKKQCGKVDLDATNLIYLCFHFRLFSSGLGEIFLFINFTASNSRCTPLQDRWLHTRTGGRQTLQCGNSLASDSSATGNSL